MEGFKAIVHGGKAVLSRFPGVMLSAALATGIAILWIFYPKGPEADLFFLRSGRFFLLGLFGIPWLYSLTIWAERRFTGKARYALPLVIGFAALGLYYLRISFISLNDGPLTFFYEAAAIWVGLHFLAAYAPYLGFEEPRGFWEYNRGVFLRFLLSLLFSGTLWIGAGIFIAILSAIFQIDFSIVYALIAVFILGIFNTWFFLAGVPTEWRALEQDPKPYPRALKFFSQFILVPLIVLIGLGLEVLFLKDWAAAKAPFQSVAPGFVFLGGFGLLAYLLLFPLDAEGKRPWLRAYRVGFFLSLLPPLGWLAYAAMGEIQKEGWTQALYYLLILSLWGIGLSLYLILARRVRIQWIPISLSLLAFISALPPLSASSVARRSQEKVLSELFTSFDLKKGTPDLKKIAALSPETKAKLGEKKDFLAVNFGCAALIPYFGENVDPNHKLDASCETRPLQLAFFPNLGPSSVPGETVAVRLNFNVTRDGGSRGVPIQGFDFYFTDSEIQFVELAEDPAQENPCDSKAPRPSLCAVLQKESSHLKLYLNQEPLGRLDLSPTLAALRAKHEGKIKPENKTDTDAYFDLSPEEMTFDYDLKPHRIRLLFSHLHLNQKEGRLVPGYVRFSALVKR